MKRSSVPSAPGRGGEGIRLAVRRYVDSLESSTLMDVLIGVLAAIARLPSRGEERQHVLIAPPGRRNIGDAALCGAFVERVPGPITVIARSVDDFPELVANAGVSVVQEPDLIYGSLRRRLPALARLALRLRGAASLSVVGADVMDGNYVLRASIARSQVARLAARGGVPSRVLGFSWSLRPTDPAPRELAKAAASGAVLYARDPQSEERLRTAGISVRTASDAVFAADSLDPRGAERLLTKLGLTDERIAIVNASGLVGSSPDSLAGYVKVVGLLMESGLTPVLLPHVHRERDGDIDAILAVQRALGMPVSIIDELLAPSTVRSLCDRAEFVVTARMHLAVMALRMGTPPVVITTQGKVEGMLELFGLRRFAVDPEQEVDVVLPRRVEEAVAGLPAIRAEIHQNYAKVRSLAMRNFEGLAPVSGDDPVRART